MKTLRVFLALLGLGAVVFAADPHPSLPAIGSLDGLGVNIHFTDPQPGELEMIRTAGFRWVRMDLTWAGTERKPGEYDFAAYDRLVTALEKHELRAVFILDYGNPLYAEPGDRHPFTSRAGTEDFRAAFAKWAAAAVSRYAGKGFLWEIWNEPNHAGFWKPKPDVQQYIALAKAAGAAIRAAAPKEAIVGPATSTIDLTFLEECMKAGLLELFDAVSVHPYRQTMPETVEEEYRSVRLLIRKYAPQDKAIPVLSGEWGYSTAYPAFAKMNDTERETAQAKYVARMFLTNIANDVPLSIWYDWRDDGDDPKEAEHRFGLVRRPYRAGEKEVFEPKPAYRAIETLNRKLSGSRFNKRLIQFVNGSSDETTVLIFSAETSDQLIGWVPSASLPGAVTRPHSFPLCQGKWNAELLVGQKNWQVDADASGLSTDPGDDVLLLAAEKESDLLKIFARWEKAPKDIWEKLPASFPSGLKVVNPLKRAIQVEIVEKQRVVRRDLAPNDVAKTNWPIQASLRFSTRSVAGVGASRSVTNTLRVWTETGPVSAMQQTCLNVLNPLQVEVYPPGNGFIAVRIDNPSGDPAKLRLDVRDRTKRKSMDYPFVFRNGQKVADFAFPLDPEAIRQGQIRIDVGEDGLEGSSAQQLTVGRPVNWGDWPRADFIGSVDGTPDDRSRLEMSAAEPPDGPSPSTRRALRLSYAFGRGWQYVQAAIANSRSNSDRTVGSGRGIPTAFCVWIHGDGKSCQPRIRFKDATGQTFQSDGPKIDFTGWRVVYFSMQSTSEGRLAHWGGENDGVIHYPIQWDSIFLLDNVSREPVEGEVYLSAPTLIY